SLAQSKNPFAMVILTALIALQKGKITETELLNQKVNLLKNLVSKGFNRGKIEALMGFLKLYVRFKKSEFDVKFDNELRETLNIPNKTMGIVEFVLERERRLGEKKGIKKGIEKGHHERDYTFVQKLLRNTDFDDAKIADLASVTTDFVKSVREENMI
ncbi:MAG: hypothetical protein EAZ14_06105, partial [Runella slithyformis]